jgi:hypothetical protein
MRILYAVAFLTFAAAAFGKADAADLRVGVSSIAPYRAGEVRAAQFAILDDEPGVTRRAYWSAPWQNRHYFPFTGKKPKVGRAENLSAKRRMSKPAESYYREWSTISLYPPGVVTPPPDNAQPLVVNETTRLAAPVK